MIKQLFGFSLVAVLILYKFSVDHFKLELSNPSEFRDLFPFEPNFQSGRINLTAGSNLFYWLFRSHSDPSTAPLLIWLSGGPGCSSEIGLFFENGPFKVDENLNLEKNPYAWNEKANLLYVD
jgi:hypothetical protein